jgi:hypothetical protein
LVRKGNENDKRPKNELCRRVEMRKMEKKKTQNRNGTKKIDCDIINKRIFSTKKENFWESFLFGGEPATPNRNDFQKYADWREIQTC